MTKRQRPTPDHVTSLSESSNVASAPQRLRPDAQRNATRVLLPSHHKTTKNKMTLNQQQSAF